MSHAPEHHEESHNEHGDPHKKPADHHGDHGHDAPAHGGDHGDHNTPHDAHAPADHGAHGHDAPAHGGAHGHDAPAHSGDHGDHSAHAPAAHGAPGHDAPHNPHATAHDAHNDHTPNSHTHPETPYFSQPVEEVSLLKTPVKILQDLYHGSVVNVANRFTEVIKSDRPVKSLFKAAFTGAKELFQGFIKNPVERIGHKIKKIPLIGNIIASTCNKVASALNWPLEAMEEVF